MPSRRELVAEILVGLAFPTYQLVQSIVSGQSPTYVVLTTLGVAALSMFILAQWEQVRQAFRRRSLAGKELMDTIDVWLRENGFGRQPYTMPGYSHAIVATYGGFTTYVGVEEQRNVLAIAATRAENQDDTATINQMEAGDWVDLKFELEQELAKFGVYYQARDIPYSITIWIPVPVDETLNEARMIERIDFLRRADALVGLIAGRRMTASLFTQTVRPNIPDVWQGSESIVAHPITGKPAIVIDSLTLSRFGQDQGSVDLRALNFGSPGLGAWTIDVVYDAAVASPTACSAKLGGVCNPGFEPNKIRVTGAIGSGVIGNSILATIQFKWVKEGVSPLSLAVEVLADATFGNPKDISPDVWNGSIVCTP
jgi:hypothetical protein